MSLQRVIVGIGNPGEKYSRTRHNVGFMVLEAFAKQYGIPLKEESRFMGRVGQVRRGGCSVRLLLPNTYMNNSGQAVRKLVNYFDVESENVLVVGDDVARPFGTLRLRGQGGAGGHNGLKSIESQLGTKEYPRLKVGVGDRQFGSLSDHVLGCFSKEEQGQLPGFMDLAVRALEVWVDENLSQAMNIVNVDPEGQQERKRKSPERGQE